MYSFSSVVRYSESDENAQLSIPALINYLQDCSTFHTESLGHGIEHLARNHFAWFITAWDIRIARLPRYCEPITVKTWCHTMRPTNAERNFLVESAEGEELVRANSLWVVYDTERERPVRIPESEFVLLAEEAPLDMGRIKRKLTIEGTGLATSPLTVSEQHLDTNHHVNNGQYVAMAHHTISAQDEHFSPHRIQVQYQQAAKLGDVIVPVLYRQETGYTVDLCDGDSLSYARVHMV